MIESAVTVDIGERPDQPHVTDGLRQLQSLWHRLLLLGRQRPKRLRVTENVPLGERRFVAVVEFEQFRFLVGGTSASLVLLANLPVHDVSAGEPERLAAEENG